MQALDPTQVDAHVLRQQHLAPDSRTDDVVQMVKDISGLYAASATTPYLSLLARIPQFRREQLDEELYTRRTLGRIRCMRKAIYILPIDLLVAAHWATRSLNVEASRRYLEYRGVSRTSYEQLSRQILDLLKGRELSANEIRHALRTALDVPAMLNFMCDQGLLIRGRLERGAPDLNFCYALFSEYFPRVRLEPMGEREATMHIVRQYLRTFGPATEADIAWWTGLGPVSAHIAVQHMRGEVIRVQIANRVENFLMLNTAVETCCQEPLLPQFVVNLLPSYDPYLLGHQNRSCYIDAQYVDRAFDQTGNVTSTIVLNGRVIGVWDLMPESGLVKLFLFRAVTDEVRTAIETAAQRIGCYMCRENVTIQWCVNMLPLTHQPPGS
ncbi:MAG TPA: winged helix DNA-binding domain-containing protein, partial [Anaerolineae bacterium]|nr:winged helix DNA-binding domain-containing protein [Anaerolineae bacterium]